MKHLTYILSCIMMAILATACSDDDFDGDASKPREGILLTLSNGSLDNKQTKTELTSSANLHHITEVYACLYLMDDTGNDGTLVLEPEKLNWNPMDSASYGVDKVQIEKFILDNTETLKAGTYRLLCVGLDAKDPTKPNSKVTYNLPDVLKINSKLSKARAKLADGKTYKDIAQSELFAGWESFDYTPGRLSEVKVEMRRRVAGVICYLKDIPVKISKEAKTYRTTSIRLRLFDQQNSSVGLMKSKELATGGKLVEDFGADPLLNNSDLLWEHKVEDYNEQTGNSELLAIPVANNNQLPNTMLGGVYLLPIKNEKKTQNTLQVEVWGKPIDEANPDDWKNGNEEFVSAFPAVYNEATEPTDRNYYNINANYVYHIGIKPDDTSLNDQPESLAGTQLNLYVKKWTTEEIKVEYPALPIYATMEFDKGYNSNYIFDCIGSKWLRIMDETNGKFTEELHHDTLLIHPSMLRKPWKLTITEPGVYIKIHEGNEPAGNEYAKEYVSSTKDDLSKETIIELLITDYINKEVNQKAPGFDLSKDFREIPLLLTTYDSIDANGSGELFNPINEEKLIIKQYNAILVEPKDGGTVYKRAFARFDLETYRDASGNIRTDITDAPYVPKDHKDVKNEDRPVTPESNDGSGVKMGYGYWHVYARYIVDTYTGYENYDGEICYENAVEKSSGGDEDKRRWKFCRSAINRAARKRVSVKETGSVTGLKLETLNDSKYWYLPASYELIEFLGQYKTFKEAMNLKLYDGKDKLYWSAQPKHLSEINAWCSYVEQNGHVWGWRDYTGEGERDGYEEKSRINTFYIRQACHVPN